MVIDVITDFSVPVRNFQRKFFALCSEKLSAFLQQYFYHS